MTITISSEWLLIYEGCLVYDPDTVQWLKALEYQAGWWKFAAPNGAEVVVPPQADHLRVLIGHVEGMELQWARCLDLLYRELRAWQPDQNLAFYTVPPVSEEWSDRHRLVGHLSVMHKMSVHRITDQEVHRQMITDHRADDGGVPHVHRPTEGEQSWQQG